MTLPVALTIAGSDPSGGAGIQADLKTFHRFGVYGTSALTMVTVQNGQGRLRVHLLDPDLVTEQIDAVATAFGISAAKTGALGSGETVAAVAAAVKRHRLWPLVVDPVLFASQGGALSGAPGELASALKTELIPRATLVTPNRLEAEVLLQAKIENERDALEAARAFLALGARAVLLKGGHFPGASATDYLVTADSVQRLSAPRVAGPEPRGTGCTLSAAITAELARARPLEAAIRRAKAFITRAIARALPVGKGAPPLDHWIAPEASDSVKPARQSTNPGQGSC